MDSIVPAISASLTLGSMFGYLYSSLSLICPASRHTVSSSTPITSQSKVHLHQWWNRKAASFRFSWAVTDSYRPLSDVLLAFLPPGYLMSLQMSSTFFSVGILSLSGLSSPCSLMSNLTASGLNLSCKYISWSHKAIISCPCTQCTRSNLSLHFCIFCVRVLLFFINCFNIRVLSLLFIVYIQIVVCYSFASSSICLFLLLRDTGVCLRLSCASLWQRCQASSYWPSYLDSVQTILSTTDMSCYHHCDDYFSVGELQCWLTIMNGYLNLLCWAVHHIYSILWLCLHFKPTSSVAWWEIASLICYLPCSMVVITLHSFCL